MHMARGKGAGAFPVYILAIGTLVGAAVGGVTAAQAAAGQAESRTVLILTTTRQVDRSATQVDLAHALLQMPLNHLGMAVRLHDLREGEPAAGSLDGVRAVITWFRRGDRSAEWLWPWLESARVEHGVRIVHFGDFGPLAEPAGDETEPPRLRRWLQRFGLEWQPQEIVDPLRVDVETIDPALCAYEAEPTRDRVHLGPRNAAAGNRAWVTTVDRDNVTDRRTPVVVGDWGGIALLPWALRPGGKYDDRRWYIDPFRFFADALGLAGVPAPDPCVLNGRRLFVFHVDGDGFESVSTVRPGALAARVMLEEVVDRYALPMTLSIVVASLTKDLQVVEPTAEMLLARELLNRPHVEPASHAVLHPLNWRRRLTPGSLPHSVVWYDSLANYRHDMVAEVRESIRFIDERLLEPGRKCRVMLWSGVANPGEDVLLETVRLGCANLNGGTYRWDELTDSVGFVEAWGQQVGSAFQVYCGAANENVFDGFFTTMPGAFAHIDRTIENTGRNRILKPANVYAHFYSAERPGRLAALQGLIQRWAFERETAPVFASTYARAVASAQTGCRIERTGRGWVLREFGDCRTVRIDGETRSIDWQRSRGLLGARAMNGALYVHLAANDAEIVWGASATPHVEQADHWLDDVVLAVDSVSLTSASFAARTVVFAGLPPNTDLRLQVDARSTSERSDADGRFKWTAPPGRSALRINTL